MTNNKKTLQTITEETIQLISHTLEDLNKIHGLNVKIQYKEKSLNPEIKTYQQRIFLNKQFLPWLAVWQIKDWNLCCELFLIYECFNNNMYAETEDLLSIAEENINDLIRKQRKLCAKETNINYELILKYQVLFAILHEYAHADVYYNNREVIDKFQEIELNYLQNLKNKHIKNIFIDKRFFAELKGMPWRQKICDLLLFLLYIPFFPFLNKCYINERIKMADGKEGKKREEEVIVDTFALLDMINFIDYNKYSESDKILLLGYISKVLLYLDFYSYFKNIATIKIFSFNTHRYTSFINTVSDELNKKRKGAGDIFKHKYYLGIFEESMLNYSLSKIIKIIKELKIKPMEENQILKQNLFKRISDLEQSIFDFAEINWEQNFSKIKF